eukprot:gene19825-25772_t
MNERKNEISNTKNILQNELKAFLAEKHVLMLDIKNRENLIEKLKSRFIINNPLTNYNNESNESTNNANESNDGKFQSYYIIKAAQKREELTRLGDELDHKIRLAEKEIRAQQLTLDHLNARNIAYRDSFKKVPLDSNETKQLGQLESQLRVTKDQLFKKKKELQRLTNDISEDEKKLELLKAQTKQMVEKKDNFVTAQNAIENELLVQQTLLSDLSDRILKTVNKHRTNCIEKKNYDKNLVKNGTLEEKSVYSEIVNDCTQNVLYTLGQLVGEFPEVSDALNSRLRDAELRIPNKPASLSVIAGEAIPVDNSNNQQVTSARSTNSNRYKQTQNKSTIVVQPRQYELEF